jgi:dynein heavy chain 2
MELLGRTDIPVNKNAGIFVTMNPAGKGYGGRSKLPDNLKQLFRPVAMSSPDVELIAETMLFSEGFKHAPKLARKVVSLFKLMKQLLSQQQHYDWALRAIKTVLNTGGQLIQAELRKGTKLDYNQEALLLIKSIRVNTISKLTYSDSYKYEYLQ